MWGARSDGMESWIQSKRKSELSTSSHGSLLVDCENRWTSRLRLWRTLKVTVYSPHDGLYSHVQGHMIKYVDKSRCGGRKIFVVVVVIFHFVFGFVFS